jgi:hypothetical protein
MYLGSPLILLVMLYAVVTALTLKYTVVLCMVTLAAVWSVLITLGWLPASGYRKIRK